ncbi:Peroxidase-like protein (plasmid) [Neorhizobium galegae bv. officinalis bv. officinalis str. HAMBI 1141]|uniref:Peroxidase-like protein n=1 Tax=Neorhizobium galegae bv. officinalis bv. officinalis str. HAMBI 1141 TaxID=1028801 RepID=A0A068TJ18_NEOGA|nr:MULTISPECIES: peroxidase-related enzyme [Neorhizobium]MCJ9669587.1 peroxidase-related enzyme [Neorhizobium sp. SHOUNA12B]MCJ9745964.1 peroxidase-related enzyme [Neorhizobium sp. SHOUNA12A]CDN57495.1 Peroxidase-like protein [Neorhizobium galegae bv. officinalis bv. officinalis str. HAMBI 1141]
MSTARFKVKALSWSPYIEPVDVATASEEQLAAMQVTPSNTKVSPYVRTLAHDPESYVARTKLFNAIMYAKGGLDRAERELGALVASAVNRCVYCASVHARRYVELSGREDVVEEIYVRGLEGPFDARTQAIADFCKALSETPSQATKEQVQALRDHGMSKAEIVDLVHSAAIFGWANRLMHTLGHSVPVEAK